MGAEKCINAKIYPSIFEVDNFFEQFLKYTTPLTTLDLSGAEPGMVDEDVLELLKLCGPSLKFLDLERCGIDASLVEPLSDTCEALHGLQHLDLAFNDLDAPAGTQLIQALAAQRDLLPMAGGGPRKGPRRADLWSIRFDGCPIGDPHDFRQDVAGLLASRGDHVVAGGELVLHLGVDGVRWFAEPRQNTLAA